MTKKILMTSLFIGLTLAGCTELESPAEEQDTTAPVTEAQESPTQTDTSMEEQTPEELFEQVQNNSPTQERIEALEDIAMYYYWYGGDLKVAEEEFFQGITLHGDYDVVEESFRQATTIDPLDVDLKKSLASAQVLQDDLPGALETLEEINHLEPDNFEALVLHSVYSKVLGEEATFEDGFERLREIDSEKAENYIELVDSVDQMKETELNTEVPDNLPTANHTFITLGYALSDEGEMEETLIERLNVTLEAAEAYPDSTLIVTGGVPKAGNTEAELMAEWLVEQGIDEERIIQEPLSTDTVENSLFAMDIVQNEDLEDVTLITSASHMRRALATFNEANQLLMELTGEDAERDFTNLVYLDYDSPEEAMEMTSEEEMTIYRDLLRTSGIWQFPGIQR